MPKVNRFAVLAAGPRVREPSDAERWDAVDVVLEFKHGPQVVLGLRTTEFAVAHQSGTGTSASSDEWEGRQPLRITLDLATVPFWDFNAVLWLGPEPWPCIAWSNAAALSSLALSTMLRMANESGSSRLLQGPDGRGLPSPEAVGVTLPDRLDWIVVDENTDDDSTDRAASEGPAAMP